jgi:hypothetical protein
MSLSLSFSILVLILFFVVILESATALQNFPTPTTMERSIPESCPRTLKLINNEVEHPKLAFMHITKAGGTTVEWVLHREATARNYSRVSERRNLYAKEVPLLKLPKGANFVTMLREPTSRFASYVHFRKYDTSPKYQRHGRELRWTARTFSNLYTRVLSGIPTGYQYAERASAGKECSKAKKILEERFAVVGTSERMLESMAVMGYVFSFQNFPVFGRINQQEGAPKFSAFSSSVRSLIIRENKCDRMLYKVADNILDRAITCLGSQFIEYLDAFTEAQGKFTKSSPGCIGKCIKYGETHRSGKARNSKQQVNRAPLI